MARKGVIINRGTVGANISGKPWKTSGLLTTGVAVSGKLALGTVYKIFRPSDANSLGLDEDYDTDNNVVVYQHILDFYDETEDGTPLYLMVVAQEQTIDDLVDVSNTDYAKKLINEANGEIYNLAVGFNPDGDYTESPTDGLNADVRTAIAKAQALWAWSVTTFQEVQIILEGRAVGGTASSALDLSAIPASPSGIEMDHKVSICIAQDWDFAETLTGNAQKYAGIGKLLGTVAKADLNQDVGEVEAFNLTQEARNRWKVAALSDHTKVKDADAELDTYHDKQYIFADIYKGISGYRWNGDFVCAPVVIDDNNNMNEHSISLGRPMNHAGRSLRIKLLPQVRKVKPVDPATGKLSLGAIKYLEGRGNEVFEKMQADGHLVAGETIVDPDSDVQTEKLVSASFNCVLYSTIAEIQGTINNKTKL